MPQRLFRGKRRATRGIFLLQQPLPCSVGFSRRRACLPFRTTHFRCQALVLPFKIRIRPCLPRVYSRPNETPPRLEPQTERGNLARDVTGENTADPRP
jgi:hypothetical protein